MKVKIEKLDHFGRGITHVNDKIAFIENALPQEIVEIQITKEKKNYLEGEVLEILEKSPIRMEEECPYSKVCGGCQLNHICYNEENKYKEEKVKEIINHTLKEDINIEKITYHNRNNYRNKITLHGKDGVLGLYQEKTNEIIPIKECLLVNPKINEIIELLENSKHNIKEVTIKTSNNNQECLVDIKGEIEDIRNLKKLCKVIIINNEYKTEEKRIETTIKDKRYKESTSSFFQINNTLTEELYNEVKENIKEEDKIILDLYCGTGTIGIYVGSEDKKIIGIDNNPSNIKDAFENKEINHLNNIDFICNKVENEIDKFDNIDLVILDPPRKGLDEKTKECLKKNKIKKIIYVSCDIYTLARDLKDLKEIFNIIKIKPFNMFPRTYHVESVCVLERRSL